MKKLVEYGCVEFAAWNTYENVEKYENYIKVKKYDRKLKKKVKLSKSI